MAEDEATRDRTEQSMSRRSYLASGVAALCVGTAGCVTTGLRLETEGVDSSDIFESISLSESWTASNATATVTLTEAAAKEASIRELGVVDAKGSSVWAGAVDPGQKSVSNVLLPIKESATVVAANASKEFVDEVTVRVVGSTIP